MSPTKTQAHAPLRSLDQRMDALKRANDVRVKRAKLKKDLKEGKVQIEKILDNPPEYVVDGEGHRHPDGGTEVRARQGRALPQHVPDQPVENRRRAVRPAARRADRPLQRQVVKEVHERPPVLVVTGPSGAGKGTLIRELVERVPGIEVTVSATTRERRRGEEDGREYWFLSDDEFLARVERGEFLEHVEFVSGHRYGTLRSELDRIAANGHVPLLELETEGALRVKREVPGAVTIFISARVDELERRLRERATESAGEIGERIELARKQLEQAGEFDHVIENDDLERAVVELTTLVRGLLGATATMPAAMIEPRVDDLLENVDSRYALVIVAAKRARQINNYHHQLGEGTFGDNLPPLVESRSKNYLTMAFEEVCEGMLKYDYAK